MDPRYSFVCLLVLDTQVFTDLDGVQLAAQKKDRETAQKYFAKYEDDVAKLLKLLG